MAAYAALVSLTHIVEQIQLHPFPPISLHKQQIESLTQNVTFLQEFLEAYSNVGSHELDSLESRIADAAYMAEDAIESQIVDQILSAQQISSTQEIISEEETSSTDEETMSDHEEISSIYAEAGSDEESSSVGSIYGEEICSSEKMYGAEINSIELYELLEKVIQQMDDMRTEVMEIKQKMRIQDQLHKNYYSASTVKNNTNTMVNFDDAVLYGIMDKLTGGQRDRQVIPIVGMGGIGKTTLARYIYESQVVEQHFDILAWVLISQKYKVRDILVELILCIKSKEGESFSQMSEDELGEKLYKSLSGRRYLITMDDVWSVEAWEKLQVFFPDNKSGSRIMITTRLSNLAFQLSGYCGLEMKFLDENKSWNLFCERVFGKESCPKELESIGKTIAERCKGLPLSLVVIAGLLAKSKKARGYWEYIADNLNSIVNSDDNERCLQILYTSYYQLPVDLKPCFLYMGVFPEDCEIHVSELIKLWVAEGFLKPIGGKSFEEAAEKYLKELIDRNLILVHKWGSNGKPKLCKIHDLLLDLSLREAEKQKFLCVSPMQDQQGRITRRNICIHRCKSVKEYHSQVLGALECSSLTRSLICHFSTHHQSSSLGHLAREFEKGDHSATSRLLRVFKMDRIFPFIAKEAYKISVLGTVFLLFNMRYLSYPDMGYIVPPSIYHFWNLHTFIAKHTKAVAPPEMWKMPLLRHVEFMLIHLPDPPGGFVLGNLHTLFRVRIWDCREKVVERLPNIKKLKIHQGELESGSLYYDCLKNLCNLHQLESLHCSLSACGFRRDLLQSLTFPHSLKKLTLQGTNLHWEDMTAEIGSLPDLQVLKLKWDSFIGSKWETFEGQFCKLKFLLIQCCHSLCCWETESTHFPRLEHLVLKHLRKLEKIPSGIGEIPTLQSIKLVACSSSAIVSAKKILEEQEDLGNEGLQVRVQE